MRIERSMNPEVILQLLSLRSQLMRGAVIQHCGGGVFAVRALAVLGVVALVVVFSTIPTLSAQLHAQRRLVAIGLGSGCLIMRPGTRTVCGLNMRVQSDITRSLLWRAQVSYDFVALEDTASPDVASLGGEIAFFDRQRSEASIFTINGAFGASILHYRATPIIFQRCLRDSCFRTNLGYEPGLMIAGTGAIGVRIRLHNGFAGYGDVRVYVPTGIGQAGFGKAPNALFVSTVFGILIH